MAILRDPSSVGDFRGHINKKIVVKGWHDQIVLTAYPNMSQVKPSEKQLAQRSLMAEAAKFAGEVRRDAAQKAAFEALCPPGKSLYHFVVRMYMERHGSR